MEDKGYSTQIFHKYACIISTKVPFIGVEYEKMNVRLQDIQYILENFEDFLSSSADRFSKSYAMLKLSELIIRFGLVDKFSEDRDFCSEDFPHTADNAVICFTSLKLLLKEIPLLEKSDKYHFFINVLLLCATHSQACHWTNDNSLSCCQEFLSEFLKFSQHKSLQSLLCDENFRTTIFKGILKKMRPSLMKDTWMLNPSSCYMFFWFLSHVKHPHLIEYLLDIFPPPFMFVSHHAVRYQVLGIQCFDHLLDNIPPSEIKLDGKEDAIFHSLFPLTYSKELPIITVMFTCLLKLPMMSAKRPQLEYWGEYDKIFSHLLYTIELENNITVRRIYLSHILAFTERRPAFKHLKRIMAVLKKNLSYNMFPDETCQVTSLKILKEVIKSCWPRMENYCFDIIVQILDLHDDKMSQDVSREETDKLSEECLYLLRHSCEEKFQSLTSSYIEDPDMPGVDLLKQAINRN